MNKEIDLAIIGAGIAGVSAAIYAKRAGLDFCIFEPNIVGGQLLLMEEVENYVGTEAGIKGANLASVLVKNLEDLEITPLKEEIINIKLEGKKVILNSKSNSYQAGALIIATGASPRKIEVSGEDEFRGKGVSYCAICDGFFFKGKDVAVVGGGNSAIEEALYLSNICRKVYIIHRRDKLRALQYLQDRAFNKENIEIVFNSIVKEIKGKNVLEQVVLENTQDKKESILSLQGLFIAIGIKPSTDTFKDLVNTDKEGFIITDQSMQTSNELIWACGDCRKRPLRQLITAASEGAIAAVSTYKYLKGTYISS